MPADSTFNRDSVAYKRDGSQVAIDVPRYETGQYGQSIMVEEETTNLVHYSDEFDNAWWIKEFVTIGADDIVAPDGTLTADKLIESAVTNVHDVGKGLLTIGQPGSVTVFARAAGRDWLAIYMAGVYTFFNLATGAMGDIGAGITPSITPVVGAAGWYKCTTSIASVVTTTFVQFNVASANGVTSYAGDVTKGIHLWRAQAELKAYPTTPHKTSGGTATRAAETLTIPSAGVLSTTAGTFEDRIKLDRAPGTNSQFILDSRDGGGGANGIRLYVTTAGKLSAFYGATQITGTTTLVKDTWYGVAVVWSSGGVEIYLNGASEGSNATVPAWTLPANAYVGSNYSGSNQLDGLGDDLRISNTAHSDAKIAADYALGTALPLEDDTTYKAPFDGTLAATSFSFFHRYLSLGDLRLDDCATIDHGPGLNLGIDEVELVKLAAGGVDGEEIASSRYTNTEMFVPIIIGPQASWDDIYAQWLAIRTELLKPTNELRFGPIDHPDLYVFDVVAPASIAHLIRGQANKPPDSLLFDPVYFPVILERRPGLPAVEPKP